MRSAITTLPCVLALAATAVLGGTASASPVIPFSVSHQDRCLASAAGGELAWQSRTSVAVTGQVSLRDPQQCAFPTRPTAVAVFTAYYGRTVVDTHRESTPVGAAGFRFALDAALSPTPVPRPIDRVTVQVCHTGSSTAAERLTCGPLSSYTP
jgi:hypothetical protein